MTVLPQWSTAMQTTTLSSKGQVIIPKTLRAALRWAPGTQLEVHDTPEGVLLRPAVLALKASLPEGLAAIRRRVAYAGPTVSLEDMSAAVLRMAAQAAQGARVASGTKAASRQAAQAPAPVATRKRGR
jgi:AbrB family looped-hinge helix DNA binding protein